MSKEFKNIDSLVIMLQIEQNRIIKDEKLYKF